MKITYEVDTETDPLTAFAFANAQNMFDTLCQMKREITNWKKEFAGQTTKTPFEIEDEFGSILWANGLTTEKFV